MKLQKLLSWLCELVLIGIAGFMVLFFVVVAFTSPVHAGGKKHPTPAPPPKLEQSQQQQQDQNQDQSQSQIANGGSVGDLSVGNDWDLSSRLDAFNNQVNNGIDYLDCAPAVGYQEIDGASHSVITLSGCVGYEDFNNTGAVSVGVVVPFVSKEAKQAFRTKVREAEREADRQANIKQLQNAFRDAVEEIQRLRREVSEIRKQTNEK